MSETKQPNDALLEANRRARAELKELRTAEGPSFLERHGLQKPSRATNEQTQNVDKK